MDKREKRKEKREKFTIYFFLNKNSSSFKNNNSVSITFVASITRIFLHQN